MSDWAEGSSSEQNDVSKQITKPKQSWGGALGELPGPNPTSLYTFKTVRTSPNPAVQSCSIVAKKTGGFSSC